ncbi:prephenate dehydrogenase [Dissulfurispira thermophila]|uniref:prephenate dehydrogenase n=2 Tax=root TaxID=1 RepID=A0A7G1GZS5_9BACT|nr:prephenate dehydrogenase/arogenate dehydrogenase family protein [Dissulfurispira thermophila]BCB95386.1 prephenate dehydrogenase [Dissulfurispira thermophila]
MTNLFFNKVSIIGVGLLGASFALALRENGLCKTIVGTGRKEDNLRRAKERGIIDAYALDVRDICEDSDLILLSTPVGAFRDIAVRIKDILKQNAIITDVGSVKGKLVHEIESLMPERVYYIGSHPIAGSDKSGIDDARADLFDNARCIVTPTEKSNEMAREKIIYMWRRFGARVEVIDPFIHDEIYAAVSHLPHIIAYTIVNTIGDIDSKYIEYAGQGFKDTTRIALSSPEMWRDIVIHNRENLLRLLDVFKENVDRIKRLLEKKDSEAIKEEFKSARGLRERLQ